MNSVVPRLQVIRRPFIIQGTDEINSTKMSATELNELVNDDEIRLTNDGKDFILGYGCYKDSFVVLGTKEFLRKLCSTDTVFMSSYNIKLKFKSFNHLFTLHCFVDNKIVPMMYALLFNNDKRTYLRMLQVIKDTSHNNNLKFNPSTFYINVDLNITPIITEMFGSQKIIKLSLYYYSNVIWHKVKSLGLSHNYNCNIEKTIRRICLLALIPLKQIDETWTKIKDEAPENENILELISYITDTFITSNKGLLNKTRWNHYDSKNIKTISHLEGFNSFIVEDINNLNLSAKNCIIKFKNMQQDFEMDTTTLEKSIVDSKSPQKYKTFEAKFNHAKERLENGIISAIEYLDEII